MENMELGEANDHDKNGMVIVTARASDVNLCNLCRKAMKDMKKNNIFATNNSAIVLAKLYESPPTRVGVT